MKTKYVFLFVLAFDIAGFSIFEFNHFTNCDSTKTLTPYYDHTNNSEELKFVFDKDYPPFTFVENGTAMGFELDFLQAIGQEAGFNVQPLPMVWDEAQKALQEGKADVIGGLVPIEERFEKYDFSESPNANLNVRIFVKEGSGTRSLLELKGKNVATEKSSSYETVLKKEEGINLVLFNTEGEGLRALAEDRVDAFVGADITSYYRIKKDKINGIMAVGTPLHMTAIYFAVKKGNNELLSRLNKGAEEIKNKGEYDKIYRKWFVEDEIGK